MKINGVLFAIISTFLAAADIGYWYFSRDPTGATCLALACGLAFLIGFYLLFTARRMEARPEDRGDADISDGSGEIGHFSPGSWWPIMLAASVLPFVLGLIYGIWLSIIGGILILVTVSGLVFEHYVGANARDW